MSCKVYSSTRRWQCSCFAPHQTCTFDSIFQALLLSLFPCQLRCTIFAVAQFELTATANTADHSLRWRPVALANFAGIVYSSFGATFLLSVIWTLVCPGKFFLELLTTSVQLHLGCTMLRHEWTSIPCIAVGYGVENMYGAESNEWTDSEGNEFIAPPEYQPYSQFYLSLDIDFDRIPTKHKWLKTIFSFLNVFKVPFPTLEINTLGQFRFHPLYF